jgi:hypothetical protein
MTSVIVDTFTDTDGTAIAAHTPDINTPGNPWASIAGVWKTLSNKAYPSSSSVLPHSVIDSTYADCTVQVDVTLYASSAKTGLVARYTDANNHWELTLSIGTGLLELIERNAGVNYTRASTSVTIATGQTHTLKLVMSGTSFTGTMDGTNTITYSSSSFQANTVHGIRGTNSQTTERHDNFSVATGVAYTLTATQQSYTLTGEAAVLSSARRLIATQASFVLTGEAANLIYARAGTYILTAIQASFALTGQPAALTYYHPPSGTPVSGFGLVLIAAYSGKNIYVLAAAQGSFGMTGIAAALTYLHIGPPTGPGAVEIFLADKRRSISPDARAAIQADKRK